MAAEGREGFAVVVYREDAAWEAGLLPDALVEDLDGLVAAVRQQPGTAIAFVDVADEFLVAARARGDDEPSLLLSDGSAAGDWPLAASVLSRVDPDGHPPDDVVPIGDLNLFGDLGLDSTDLREILGDLDAYADEMLASIAKRLGFAAALDRALDAAGHWRT